MIRSCPLVRSKGCSPRTNDLTRQPAVTDRQKEKEQEKKRYPGCLAHVVSGMFFCVVAYRRQPNLYNRGGNRGLDDEKKKGSNPNSPARTYMPSYRWFKRTVPHRAETQKERWGKRAIVLSLQKLGKDEILEKKSISRPRFFVLSFSFFKYNDQGLLTFRSRMVYVHVYGSEGHCNVSLLDIKRYTAKRKDS